MIKALKKLEIEETQEKLYMMNPYQHPNQEIWEHFLNTLSLSLLLFDAMLQVLATNNKTKNGGHVLERKKIKLSIFADGMTPFLDLISIFSKVADNKNQ